MQKPSGIVPHLTVNDANAAIAFYQKALGAKEIMRMPADDGKRLMHAELQIGNATFYLNDDFPEYCGGKLKAATSLGGTPVTLHQYVPDVDAAIARAQEFGAQVAMPAQDMFWGDRYGSVKDPFGHSWSFATPLKK